MLVICDVIRVQNRVEAAKSLSRENDDIFDVLISVDKKIVIFYVENFCKIQLQVLL